MRKLTYLIIPPSGTMGREDAPYGVEFITDRTPLWTEQQYLRHRGGYKMELISDEETEEEKPVSREVELG
jgi:hypothetical protein